MLEPCPSAVLFLPPSEDDLVRFFDGESAAPGCFWFDNVGEPSPGTVHRPRALARFPTRPAREMSLTIGDSGLSYIDGEDGRHTVLWDEVVRMGQGPDEPAQQCVHGINLCLIPVHAYLVAGPPSTICAGGWDAPGPRPDDAEKTSR